MVTADMVEYVGTVKSFNLRKGWGFIECPETQEIYGKDILFQKSELPAHVEKGDRLSFSITQGRNGVLAVGLQLLDKVPHQMKSLPDNGLLQDSAAPGAGAGMGPSMGNFTGVIKSYNPQKGWGFVECLETQQIYGKDILVLKEELRGVPVSTGQRVAFSVSQGRKGPLATSIRLLGGGGGGATPGLDRAPILAQPGRGTKRKLQEAEEQASQSFLGTIKSFNPTRGWGFVECAETHQIYGKDILVLKDELAGVSVGPGQRVSFSVVQGRNGPLATDIQILVPAGAAHLRSRLAMMPPVAGLQAMPMYNPFAMPRVGGCGALSNGASRRLSSQGKMPDPQEHICGIIKSFDEQNGWGFVTGEAILQLYGKDVYISKVALQGQTVSPGDQVMFSVEMGLKGPMATGVTLLPSGSFVAEGVPGTVYTGTIKSFNAEKGWGFVTSEETTQIFGKDLFLHKRELGDTGTPSAGDQVMFTVQLSAGGRPEAAGLSPVAAT